MLPTESSWLRRGDRSCVARCEEVEERRQRGHKQEGQEKYLEMEYCQQLETGGEGEGRKRSSYAKA